MRTVTYEVAELSIGDKVKGDKIVFKSREDLERAVSDIDNAKDIYVIEPDGTLTLLLNRVINTKVYDMSIKLSAVVTKDEKKKMKDEMKNERGGKVNVRCIS